MKEWVSVKECVGERVGHSRSGSCKSGLVKEWVGKELVSERVG